MFKRSKENKKGFTLAELLIVVAIIGVLVAVSIPIFTAQLEKSREAVDAANIRAAYAQVMADAVTNEETAEPVSVVMKQTVKGWVSTVDWPAGFDVTEITAKDVDIAKKTVVVSYDKTTHSAVAKFASAE